MFLDSRQFQILHKFRISVKDLNNTIILQNSKMSQRGRGREKERDKSSKQTFKALQLLNNDIEKYRLSQELQERNIKNRHAQEHMTQNMTTPKLTQNQKPLKQYQRSQQSSLSSSLHVPSSFSLKSYEHIPHSLSTPLQRPILSHSPSAPIQSFAQNTLPTSNPSSQTSSCRQISSRSPSPPNQSFTQNIHLLSKPLSQHKQAGPSSTQRKCLSARRGNEEEWTKDKAISHDIVQSLK